MIGFIIRKIIGSPNEREVRCLRRLGARINEIEAGLKSLPDDELRGRTANWKARLSATKDNAVLAASLNEILPEAFAAVKNACRRLTERREKIIVRGHPLIWAMIPFDVQLIGGIALHSGKIAEMATGEGKTLVATMPVYLHALAGRGVHIVTVNDYLAARDSEWMGLLYKFLGLTVGCILHDQPPNIRREQYNCDITYGASTEFGFDYLRDNGMASRAEEQVQRGHYCAILDGVDSILIDNARTPLIISGPAVLGQDTDDYVKYKPSVELLVRTQEQLCEGFLGVAESMIKRIRNQSAKASSSALLEREIGLLLHRVKLGLPHSPGLRMLLQEPENERLRRKAELELQADQTKQDLYAQTQELCFVIDEKGHKAELTEKGRVLLDPNDPVAFVPPDLARAYSSIESMFGLGSDACNERKAMAKSDFEAKQQALHCISQLLRAYCLYFKDVHYVVQDNKVIIVDENTRCLVTGHRWSDGLHQAVEAKEGLEIERETQTLATITIQNYFRLYLKLAGMTGTAETEAAEFFDIYKLGVLVIPTNKPTIRKDRNDSVYKTKREKFTAVLNEIKEVHAQGRPILVGTISVEVSEQISWMLKREGIVHSVLNAKIHQQEAEVIARAGQRGSVTIIANMAVRGTNIKLGPGIAEVGGLHVLATERHEARRTDRQLRELCALQGSPGSSHFIISLEDDLMRSAGSGRIVKIMEKMGLEENQELEHPLLNRSIEQAQKRVEGHNFQIRKRTLEYDDVLNKQRLVVYGFRNQIIHGENVRDRIMDIMEEVVLLKVQQLTTAQFDENEWNCRQLADWVNQNFPLGLPEAGIHTAARSGKETPVPGSVFEGLSAAQFAVCGFITENVRKAYDLKISFEDPEALKAVERFTVLGAIDRLWQEHLREMDGLRSGIGLRAPGQGDPLVEYGAEASAMFERLMASIKAEVCKNIFRSASSLEAFENFLRALPKSPTS